MGILSPQGYLTVCPLIPHIYFAGFLYQGFCSQTVLVLKELTASGLEGMAPPLSPCTPTHNPAFGGPEPLGSTLASEFAPWPGASFHFLHSATLNLLPSKVGSGVSSSRFVFLAGLPSTASELPSDSPITALSTQLSPPSFWPSQAACTGGNTNASQG